MKRILITVLLLTVAFGAFADWHIHRSTDPLYDTETVLLANITEDGSFIVRKKPGLELFISMPRTIDSRTFITRIDGGEVEVWTASLSTDKQAIFFTPEQIEKLLKSREKLVFRVKYKYAGEETLVIDMAEFQAKYREAFGRNP